MRKQNSRRIAFWRRIFIIHLIDSLIRRKRTLLDDKVSADHYPHVQSFNRLNIFILTPSPPLENNFNGEKKLSNSFSLRAQTLLFHCKINISYSFYFDILCIIYWKRKNNRTRERTRKKGALLNPVKHPGVFHIGFQWIYGDINMQLYFRVRHKCRRSCMDWENKDEHLEKKKQKSKFLNVNKDLFLTSFTEKSSIDLIAITLSITIETDITRAEISTECVITSV